MLVVCYGNVNACWWQLLLLLAVRAKTFLIACNDSEPLTNWDFEKINELSIS